MTAPCTGQSRLFDSTLLADHTEAVKLCAACPLITACQRLLEDCDRMRSGGPEGTWAGRLVVAGKVVTTTRRDVAAEEAAYTEEEARKAHALFWHGHRDEWTLAGERTYQRRSERRKRARRRAAA